MCCIVKYTTVLWCQYWNFYLNYKTSPVMRFLAQLFGTTLHHISNIYRSLRYFCPVFDYGSVVLWFQWKLKHHIFSFQTCMWFCGIADGTMVHHKSETEEQALAFGTTKPWVRKLKCYGSATMGLKMPFYVPLLIWDIQSKALLKMPPL